MALTNHIRAGTSRASIAQPAPTATATATATATRTIMSSVRARSARHAPSKKIYEE